MVGWLRWSGERGLMPRIYKDRPLGLNLLSAALPDGKPRRRLSQGAAALRRRGIRRAVLSPSLGDGEKLAEFGLSPVDPMPLCRALGAQLAFARLEEIPLRERRVALRGECVDPVALDLAQKLCPRTGALLLEFDRGGEDLARRLWWQYGTAPFSLDNAPPPQVTLELSPRETSLPGTIQLWGKPDLGDLELRCDLEIPDDLPWLPTLTLLWEAGRLPLSAFRVERTKEPESGEIP